MDCDVDGKLGSVKRNGCIISGGRRNSWMAMRGIVSGMNFSPEVAESHFQNGLDSLSPGDKAGVKKKAPSLDALMRELSGAKDTRVSGSYEVVRDEKGTTVNQNVHHRQTKQSAKSRTLAMQGKGSLNSPAETLMQRSESARSLMETGKSKKLVSEMDIAYNRNQNSIDLAKKDGSLLRDKELASRDKLRSSGNMTVLDRSIQGFRQMPDLSAKQVDAEKARSEVKVLRNPAHYTKTSEQKAEEAAKLLEDLLGVSAVDSKNMSL